MTKKEEKVCHIVLAGLSVIMALLMIDVDVQARKADKYEKELTQKEYYYELGNDLENYVLDVVYETDIFDDITEEETEYLNELFDGGDTGLYYIKLIELCEKYYGNNESK